MTSSASLMLYVLSCMLDLQVSSVKPRLDNEKNELRLKNHLYLVLTCEISSISDRLASLGLLILEEEIRSET